MKFRKLFIAALIAGASYFLADHLMGPGPGLIAWKGSGVGLLALWAAANARQFDGWLIAGVMALGATGDVLLNGVGVVAGAVAFLAGHLLAIWLYRRQRRVRLAPSQTALSMALFVLTPLIAFHLPRDHSMRPLAALYGIGLGAMAASAWVSRFPRDRVGLGAVLFVASDMLIFAQGGPFMGPALLDLLVWPLYFAGQVLIAWGVVSTLAGETR